MTTRTVLFAIAVSGVSACVDEPTGEDVRADTLDDNSAGPKSASPDEVDAKPVGVPQAAHTNSIVFTNGTRAAEVWFNRSGDDAACGGPCLAVLDAKCDSHSAYVDYFINDVRQKHGANGGGCNSTLRIPVSGSYNIKYRACIDLQLSDDLCAKDWSFDHNP
jgi:hypothetical protein